MTHTHPILSEHKQRPFQMSPSKTGRWDDMVVWVPACLLACLCGQACASISAVTTQACSTSQFHCTLHIPFNRINSNTHTPNTYKYLSLSCLLLHQTPVTSHWIQTQQTVTSICLRGTGGWRGEMSSSHILIIQRDLIVGVRCCVERVCLDAATGRLSGVGQLT